MVTHRLKSLRICDRVLKVFEIKFLKKKIITIFPSFTLLELEFNTKDIILMTLISVENKVVIFGANGMVGSAICRLLKKRGFRKIYTPSRMELNLTNQSAVRNWFKKNSPDIVLIEGESWRYIRK